MFDPEGAPARRLLRPSPNILLIPGASSLAHLNEYLAAGSLELPDDAMAALNAIAGQAVRASGPRDAGPRRG